LLAAGGCVLYHAVVRSTANEYFGFRDTSRSVGEDAIASGCLIS
jgi:hypothetical protein